MLASKYVFWEITSGGCLTAKNLFILTSEENLIRFAASFKCCLQSLLNFLDVVYTRFNLGFCFKVTHYINFFQFLKYSIFRDNFLGSDLGGHSGCQSRHLQYNSDDANNSNIDCNFENCCWCVNYLNSKSFA